MPARFSDKSVVITGGASGIGLATARRFIQDGAARLAIVDRAADRLASACAELRSAGCGGDRGRGGYRYA